jgi:hypothetical protein
VNLHMQCHHLIHFDIPWSLIRIEQRNGRIDRYGQKHRPVITTLLLNPTSERFAGDVRVLARLVEKEHEAHKALGDSASLMGKYDVGAEEEAIRQVLAGEQTLDDAVRSPEEVAASEDFDGMLARLFELSEKPPTTTPTAAAAAASGVYPDDLSFLRDALEQSLETPGAPPPNGVSWREHTGHAVVEFRPTPDLRQRLDVLPQPYLRARRVHEQLKLATNLARGKQELINARATETAWPEAHYLSPLHPALDWAADRALSSLGRNQVFAVEGPVEDVALLVHGSLTNARGQMVASSFIVVTFPNQDSPGFTLPQAFPSAREALESLGVAGERANRGRLTDVESLQRYVEPGVTAGRRLLGDVVGAAEKDIEDRVRRWSYRVSRWDEEAGALIQRSEVRDRRQRVDEERQMASSMLPDQQLVRPLLLVVPDESEGGR